MKIVWSFTIPAHSLYFFGYEITKKNVQPNRADSEKGPLTHFSAGLVAEFLGALIWTPMVSWCCMYSLYVCE